MTNDAPPAERIAHIRANWRDAPDRLAGGASTIVNELLGAIDARDQHIAEGIVSLCVCAEGVKTPRMGCDCVTCTVKRAESRALAAEARLAEVEGEKDGAYTERNRLVAYLARQFPSGIKPTIIEGWDAEWHSCVYIDTPTGQMSWHYHDTQAAMFESLPPYQGEWDGHTTEQKYQRLELLSATPPPNPTPSYPGLPEGVGEMTTALINLALDSALTTSERATVSAAIRMLRRQASALAGARSAALEEAAMADVVKIRRRSVERVTLSGGEEITEALVVAEEDRRRLLALLDSELAAANDRLDNAYLRQIKAEAERDMLLGAAMDVEADLIAYMLVQAAGLPDGPSVDQYKEMMAKLRDAIRALGTPAEKEK